MKPLRPIAVLVLCFCLAVSGSAAARPSTAMALSSIAADSSIVADSSMDADCPDMAAASLPDRDDATAPIEHERPDCCKSGACQCAGAHGAFVTPRSFDAPRIAPVTTTVEASAGSLYASPALARLVRPPIS